MATKPRTIADLLSLWACSLRDDEPCMSVTCSSLESQGDVLYHYGSHWPMAVVDRDARGRARVVYVNSNGCNVSSGFGNTTDGLMCQLRGEIRAHAPRWLEVRHVPMGDLSYVSTPTIRTRPRTDDPEPQARWEYEVPPYFYVADPGPEPVKDPTGCIAGRTESYAYAEVVYDFSVDVIPEWDYCVPVPKSYDRTRFDYRVWHTGTIEWVVPSTWQTYYSSEGTERKACPHCIDFNRVHSNWSQRFYGRKGYREYAIQMARFGSEETWRAARLQDFRTVKAGRKAHAEWLDRNTIPQDALTHLRGGYLRHVPKLSPDGYPLVKDAELYWKRQRERERRRRREQREHEARERHRRQVERFARGIRRRRKPRFEHIASELAIDLANVRQSLLTNDSSEELNP